MYSDVRIHEITTFTPLVLYTRGGMGRASSIFYIRLALLIVVEWDECCSRTMNWICYCLSSALWQLSARSSKHHSILEQLLDLQLVEGPTRSGITKQNSLSRMSLWDCRTSSFVDPTLTVVAQEF